jgi:hypothetical protein
LARRTATSTWALEQGRNYRNVLANPRVFFVIERGIPDRFIQGEGIAERLGPIEERPRAQQSSSARRSSWCSLPSSSPG